MIANVAELADQHLSGLGRVSLLVCMCVCVCVCVCVCAPTVAVGVGKRDVLNERVAGEHTHTHTHTHKTSSISAAVSPHFAPCCLLSMFIWQRPLELVPA